MHPWLGRIAVLPAASLSHSAARGESASLASRVYIVVTRIRFVSKAGGEDFAGRNARLACGFATEQATRQPPLINWPPRVGASIDQTP